MERIQINGKWYVSEESLPQEQQIELDLLRSINVVYEDDELFLEFSIPYASDDETHEYDFGCLKVTFKHNDKTEYWDNSTFLSNICENGVVVLDDEELMSGNMNISHNHKIIIVNFLKLIRKKYQYI